MKKMKKYISLLLSAAMVAAMTAGCGSSTTNDTKDTSTASASADESGTETSGTSTEVQVTPPSDLVESGKLTYAVAATFAPYEYAD